MLSGRVVPPEGGNTDFADMRAVWDDLPETMKKRVEGLTAEHSYWHSRSLALGEPVEPEPGVFPPVTQPLVRRHPRTGRKSIVLASHIARVHGMSDEDSDALLRELTEFALRPRYVCSYRWSAGDVVIWDNRCTMHRGTPFDDRRHTRDMRRTTVQGPSRYAQAA
jgi:alpha-ketoglutarate-dependent 2,4-dichlorophenoxyacetate dioxygenase